MTKITKAVFPVAGGARFLPAAKTNHREMLNYVRTLIPANMKCVHIRQPEAL